MRCALCGKERKLIKAHVIPHSFHRIDPADKKPSRLLTNAAGRYPQKVPKGVYDAGIVCEECERLFSPWDDYATETFLQSWNSFQKIRSGAQEFGFWRDSYDYGKLKLFFISLLWRAGVSQHHMFSKIELGPHEAKLRSSILRGDPGDLHYYGVALQAFDSTDVGILDPHPERFFNVKFNRFYLGHIIAFIKVDSRPMPTPFLPVTLGSEKRLILTQKNFASSPERQLMQKLVIADRARAEKH